jgi:hypothetical protein
MIKDKKQDEPWWQEYTNFTQISKNIVKKFALKNKKRKEIFLDYVNKLEEEKKKKEEQEKVAKRNKRKKEREEKIKKKREKETVLTPVNLFDNNVDCIIPEVKDKTEITDDDLQEEINEMIFFFEEKLEQHEFQILKKLFFDRINNLTEQRIKLVVKEFKDRNKRIGTRFHVLLTDVIVTSVSEGMDKQLHIREVVRKILSQCSLSKIVNAKDSDLKKQLIDIATSKTLDMTQSERFTEISKLVVNNVDKLFIFSKTDMNLYKKFNSTDEKDDFIKERIKKHKEIEKEIAETGYVKEELNRVREHELPLFGNVTKFVEYGNKITKKHDPLKIALARIFTGIRLYNLELPPNMTVSEFF